MATTGDQAVSENQAATTAASLYSAQELARHEQIRERCQVARGAGSVVARFIFGDLDVAIDPTLTSPMMRDEMLVDLEAELDREDARLKLETLGATS